jgi:hypothetical protein
MEGGGGMADLDRAVLIELLGRLGAESDETVLQAGRELHRKVRESGANWDELIRPQPLAAEARPEADSAGDPDDADEAADSPPAPAPRITTPDQAETASCQPICEKNSRR